MVKVSRFQHIELVVCPNLSTSVTIWQHFQEFHNTLKTFENLAQVWHENFEESLRLWGE